MPHEVDFHGEKKSPHNPELGENKKLKNTEYQKSKWEIF